MKKLNFSIHINAPKEHLWRTLWDDASYRQWTAVFTPGSYAVSDWQEGSKILFLSPGGDGMTSRIARLVPHEFMSFEHLGEVVKGEEDFTKDWAGVFENYTLSESDGGTELLVELDSSDEFEDYMSGIFPNALNKLKELAEEQKITPFLWFDKEAEEAVTFYVSVFPNSGILNVQRQGESAFVLDFTLSGHRFTALNGGPMFRFNPSVSFFVTCETEAETDAIWQKLMDGGIALLPLEKQPWSEKYGWAQDRYGLTWQISWGKLSEVHGQKIVPSLLFTGEHFGQAEAALRCYTSLFSGCSTDGIMLYGAEGPGTEGSVMHAQCLLNGQVFMFMDDPMQQTEYTFNEAISFVVHCQDQAEVDYFWENLIAKGGQESQCGWLKDPFGVSWQIIPKELTKLLADPDPVRAQQATGAMLQMRKIDIAKLRQAADHEGRAVIMVQTIVNAPVEMVWQRWTQPEHIIHWNFASDDWCSPHAENDLRPGGSFSSRMESKDGKMGFDFKGIYSSVAENEHLAYILEDDRKVQVHFSHVDGGTCITETFEAENTHPQEMQRAGWQAILDNFKKYVEEN